MNPAAALPADPRGRALGAMFLSACRAELAALKPGNVHVHAPGHGMEAAHFEAAAVAASRVISDPSLAFGARVREAVAASMAAAGCNTNLGILLLSAPLLTAALEGEPERLHQNVKCVLAALDENDAANVYAAIRLANPGGLGTSQEADVAAPPPLPLVDAMRLAASRDRIAAAYANGFRDIFEDHLPVLAAARAEVVKTPGATDADAVATLHMSILARFPDSHIGRKYGSEVQRHVMQLAEAARPHWQPIVRCESYPALLALDADLKFNAWNPGTTADFVVATILAADLSQDGAVIPLSNTRP